MPIGHVAKVTVPYQYEARMKVSGKWAHIDFTFLIREYALVWGVERINGVYANVTVM